MIESSAGGVAQKLKGVPIAPITGDSNSAGNGRKTGRDEIQLPGNFVVELCPRVYFIRL